MTYQDVLDDQGQPIKAGARDCGGRYDAIAAQLDGRGFSVLDLGAYAGYFSIRLAHEFDAQVTAVDDYPTLTERCRGWSNITVIGRRLTATDIDELGRFDVVLALSVLHHMADWPNTLDVLAANSGRLFVETPDPAETLPKAVAHCPELAAAVEALGGEPIARTCGYRSTIERTLWVVS